MIALPIVERELRLAARRGQTRWLRLAGAALAMILFAVIELVLRLSGGPVSAGRSAFTVLVWLSFAAAFSAGMFLTADSLSEEKREGTLGLLFLTDLRGADVVLGKLVSHSIQAFYGLLAAFPIISMTLLAGGVGGAEFWRSLLVITNTLFFSLAAGLMVSSVSREANNSMTGTLLLFLLVLGGLPLVDSALNGWASAGVAPRFSYGSPGWLLAKAAWLPTGNFWSALGLQHALGWLFLAAACLFAPRTWQEKGSYATSGRGGLARQIRYGGPKARARWRRQRLDPESVFWIAMRDRWLPRLMWTIAIVAVAVCALAWIFAGRHSWTVNVAQGCVSIALLGLYVWMPSQAARFYIESVRSGALELILVTPVTPERIVRSQWKALRGNFLIPAILLALAQAAVTLLNGEQMRRSLPGGTPLPGFDVSYQVGAAVVGGVELFFTLAAVAWFGMWMGMRNRKPGIALLKTLVFVIVLPSVAMTFLLGALSFAYMTVVMAKFKSGTGSFILIWWYLIGGAAFTVAKDVFFIWLSKKRLLTGFREAAMREKPAAASGTAVTPPLAPVSITPFLPPLPPAQSERNDGKP